MTTGIAAILCGIGIACLFFRQSFLGLLLGSQISFAGATLFLVVFGKKAGILLQGHVFGIFIVLVGLVQLTGGLAIATRLFFLKKSVSMNEVRSLKH